jgi:tRNA pseudouridine65 synthase
VDEHLVAVSKPSGLLVHRDRNHPAAQAALQLVRDQTGRFVYPVHRLDRATSGLLLFAFSSTMAAALQRSLAAPTARKEYLALIRYPGSGAELGPRWSCDRPLTDENDVPRPARSDFEIVEAFSRCALVRVLLASGRYHQIRRHLNHCGRHVIGDTTHGKGRINRFFRAHHGLHRLFLHLHRLQLAHPLGAEPLDLIEPLPGELEAVLATLRQARETDRRTAPG